MLVVSRKQNESIKIEPANGIDPSLTLRDVFAQGPIVVVVKHVGPRRVRIAIEAPSGLSILRSEPADRECDQMRSPAVPKIID